MGSHLQNTVPKVIAIFIWVAIQAAMFGYFCWYYYTDPQFFYTRKYLGLGLVFARGPSNCINLNCALILLPVCRNLVSLLRTRLCGCCLRSVRRLLDQNIEFHKLCAYAIMFWSAMHTGAHLYNAQYYVGAQTADPSQAVGFPVPFPSAVDYNVTVFELNTLGMTSVCPKMGREWINPVCEVDGITVIETIKIFPAVTGIIITLSLIIIGVSATEFIRRSYFEVFWFTHHLFVVFFAFVFLHGLLGVVRTQTNISEHDPDKCSQTPFTEWGKTVECPFPEFASSTPLSWAWIIGPVLLYTIECIIRLKHTFERVVITKVVNHPSNVLELQMKKYNFKMVAGQYIFIKCRTISWLEWHPFTLTSSGDDDFFSVHIRLAGDWTQELAELCHGEGGKNKETHELPIVAVDGPFGTASDDWDLYEVDVFVGAGIGVTPFASLLKHLWYMNSENREATKVRKVVFYWLCPDTNAFEWFVDLLRHLEQQMEERKMTDFLTVNIFLTRGFARDAQNLALAADEEKDAITGLKQKTRYGRPNWDDEFKALSVAHPTTRIGVFFCGAPVLSDTLNAMSNKYSSNNPSEVHFVYNKENF